MENKQTHITSIGGQAVMEGVMMRGPFRTATSVRKPDGEIECKVDENGTRTRGKFFSLPLVRGCVSFVDSLVIGMKALMWSASFVDIEEDEEDASGDEGGFLDRLFDRLDKKSAKSDKNEGNSDALKDFAIGAAVVISIIFSVGLFMVLPWLVSLLIGMVTESNFLITLGEGIIRMVIFLTYMLLISRMKEIQRTFEYHGAEHKTIACYEAGDELTPENVKKYPRLHPRCGTSFLLFVMVISILIFLLIPPFTFIDGTVLRKLASIGARLCLLPIVAGLSYEVIRLAGRSKNKCVAVLTKPGLWLQKITTREPDLSQIEVAIASMKPCIPENKEDDKW